jgi:hypothetical protein
MSELLAMLASPQARHAMSVHLPIAAAILGLGPLILAACGGFRSVSMRSAAIVCFMIVSAGAFIAAQTGHHAAQAVRADQAPLALHEEALLATHERRGQAAWIWPLLPAALVAATFIGRRPVRLIAGPLATLSGIAVAWWMLTIAHVGGTLVYEHGLGVPLRTPCETSPLLHDRNPSTEQPPSCHRRVRRLREVPVAVGQINRCGGPRFRRSGVGA